MSQAVNQDAAAGMGAERGRSERELEIIGRVAQALNGSLTLDEAMDVVLSEVAEHFGLGIGWIWLLRPDSGDSYLAAALGLPPALAEHPERMAGGCYCLDSFRAGDLEGAANINVIRCSRLRWLTEGTRGLEFHASVPMVAQDKPLGVLNLGSAQWRELSHEELRLLHTIGDMLAVAVERARLHASSAALGALKERNRLAREIHDTLAQSLAGLALQLESAQAMLEGGASAAQVDERLEAALGLTRDSLEAARRSVQDLRADELEGRDLVEALEGLAGGSSPQAELRLKGDPRPLPRGLAIGLFRIAQESLRNVQRHAQAKSTAIELVYGLKSLSLRVTDDGLGFDPDQVADDRFGIRGMLERAKLLGGKLEINSRPGAGTSLSLRLPLAESDEQG